MKKGGLLIIGGLVPLCLLCQEILKFFHNPLPIIPGFSPFLVKISQPPITVISGNSHPPLYEGQGGHSDYWGTFSDIRIFIFCIKAIEGMQFVLFCFPCNYDLFGKWYRILLEKSFFVKQFLISKISFLQKMEV